ncbi:MAG: hypothetical protein P8Y01_11205 [Woeseiaceae bacterium]
MMIVAITVMLRRLARCCGYQSYRQGRAEDLLGIVVLIVAVTVVPTILVVIVRPSPLVP